MSNLASSISKFLPKPKYTGLNEELPAHTQPKGFKGPRLVNAANLDGQIILKRKGPPPYGQRDGWRPSGPEDFGDGGAFPEIFIAQYPFDMGKKSTPSSNALALKVDNEGKVDYDVVARRGHTTSRIIHSSFKDLIPLRQQANGGDLSLERPSEEEVQATKAKTEAAIAVIVGNATAAQSTKRLHGNASAAPTYVKYTPSLGQMGDHAPKQNRIIKIVERAVDPFEPSKFKAKKIPGRAPSPPLPLMHSPPRKLTAADQEAWKIPPPISNWKNPKGYTIPLDKRLAADGRGMKDVTINDKFGRFSEALFVAECHSREEVQKRAMMEHKLAEKMKEQKEEELRKLAQSAREERLVATTESSSAARHRRRSRSKSKSMSSSRSRSVSASDREDSHRGHNSAVKYRRDITSRQRRRSSGRRSRNRRDRRNRTLSSSRSRSVSNRRREDDKKRARELERLDQAKERKRELRQSKMGKERRIQTMAREQGRDISEKIALGLAKPSASAESMYDSRLFNQTSGFAAGFNEDQPYDKPLFAAREALNAIYRNKPQDNEDDEDAEATLDRLKKTGSKRFNSKNSVVEARDGPVQFVRGHDQIASSNSTSRAVGAAKADDPFGVDQMIDEALGKKRYGIHEKGSERESKRAKRGDKNDDDDGED